MVYKVYSRLQKTEVAWKACKSWVNQNGRQHPGPGEVIAPKQRKNILHLVLALIRSQCRVWRSGVVWSVLGAFMMRQTALFRTFWSLFRRYWSFRSMQTQINWKNKHINKYINKYTHTHASTHMHARTHACTHTHTNIQHWGKYLKTW